MAPREPGWYPDPENPTSLQRYHDGRDWTGDSRPTGYVTQPAGPEPVAAPAERTRPVFGAEPAATGGPEGARRRWRTAQVAVAVTVVVALLALALGAFGVL